MPFYTSDVPGPVQQAARDRRLVPLIGAGVSRQTAHPFPNWDGLLREMNDEIVKKNRISTAEHSNISDMLNERRFLAAAQEIRDRLHRSEYEGLLVQFFDPPKVMPAPIHSRIFEIEAPIYMTINYDRLLEHGYGSVNPQQLDDYDYFQWVEVQAKLQNPSASNRPLLYKLHGNIKSPVKIILTLRDYQDLIYEQSWFKLLLTTIFMSFTVVMIGYSCSDPELERILEEMQVASQYRSPLDYIFLPKDELNEIRKKRLREDFGVEVIPYIPTPPAYPELLEFVEYLISCK